MANELNWVRERATHTETEMMLITPDQAIESECQPGTYQIDRWAFTGTVPVRMAKALGKCTGDLVNTETETEVLHLGNGYVSGQGQCRYYRSTYKLVTA